jgi:uncharacterized protein
VLGAAIAAWIAAQGVKIVLHLATQRKLDLRFFLSTGGMPSAHSAFVSATAWGTGLLAGFDSPMFAVAVVFASIVMFDAQSVRWAASRQARLLNQIVDELFQGHPISEERLKELLGHTPFQVFAGAGVGILVAWLVVRR